MSTVAGDVDWLYYFIYWLSVVLFVAIVGAMVYWAIKYRERPGHKAEPTGHNMPLEVAWTVAPIFILVFLFHKGFQGYMDMTIAPANAMEVRVNAKQWGWEFVYPNGGSSDELHVPVHKPVKLVMASADVIHSFFMPALRVKRDVVPGMYTSQSGSRRRTRATTTSSCAEYCGGRSKGPNGELPYQPSTTRTTRSRRAGDGPLGDALDALRRDARGLRQVPEEHRRQVRAVRVDRQAVPREIAAGAGREALRRTKGCVACHTTTARPVVGPSWKGIWGKRRVDRRRRGQGRRELHPRVDPRAAGEDRDRLPAR